MTARTGEFELIARHFAPLARGFPGAFGLRDDAALIVPAPGHELVVKTDALVGGVHFLADDPPGLVARKALRVNLSDLAAKGAVPRAYLLDFIVPDDTPEAWIEAFALGLAIDQELHGVKLIGGDTDRTPGPATFAITALGEVVAGRMIRRDGARAGDTLYVTGTLGDAALGLGVLRGELQVPLAARRYLAGRYRLPQPRVKLGPRLVGHAGAAIDVSDGLVADAGHLCEASGVRAVIEAARVPLSRAAREALAKDAALWPRVLCGGDDYEILFAAPGAFAAGLAALGRSVGVPVTAIGTLHAAQADAGTVVVRDAHGRSLVLPERGWTHF